MARCARRRGAHGHRRRRASRRADRSDAPRDDVRARTRAPHPPPTRGEALRTETAKSLEPRLALVRFYPTSDYPRGSVAVQDRRLGYRIPFEAMVTSYVHDRPVRGLSQNLSDTGLNMSAISMLAPPPGLVVALEIDIPGIDDSIWASGQICHRTDDHMASGLGVRFVAMAKSQAR